MTTRPNPRLRSSKCEQNTGKYSRGKLYLKQAWAAIIHSALVSAKMTSLSLGCCPSANTPLPKLLIRSNTSSKLAHVYSPRTSWKTHAHICMNTHATIHTHVYTHTVTHTNTQTHTQTCTHTNTHKHTEGHAQTHTHICTHTNTHTHTHMHTHTYRVTIRSLDPCQTNTSQMKTANESFSNFLWRVHPTTSFSCVFYAVVLGRMQKVKSVRVVTRFNFLITYLLSHKTSYARQGANFKSPFLIISPIWRLKTIIIKKQTCKINLGICIAPSQPFLVALGAESRVLPG
jgi:hypothetical protein